MFKSAIVYRITHPGMKASAVEAGLRKREFSECGPTQALSIGWMPPRGEAGAPLLEVVGNQWMTRMGFEERVLPPNAVKRRVEEMAKKIEEETGKKPGKKVKAELKEEALLEMLPRAFSRRSELYAWISPRSGLLVIDATTLKRSDVVVTHLIEAVPGLQVRPLKTHESPQACMTAWLASGDGPTGFSIDNDGELRSSDAMKSVVRYKNYGMGDADDVKRHLAAGKVPFKLGLTYNSRVSFMLTSDMQLKRVGFLGVVFEGRQEGVDQFDADVAILTGEMEPLITSLVDSLGGEMSVEAQGGQTSEVPEPKHESELETI